MNVDEIEIKVMTAADRSAVKKLYQEAGWWRANDETTDDCAWIDTLVAQSICFVGAFRRGEMVGMGRAISDGVSDAYIQDVVVRKQCRGAGIGARIIAEIVSFLNNRGIGWIGLIAEPDTQAFYQRLGFAAMPGYTPMLLQKK
jgi:ribosomal protein S18 acetylase RimI-like enzyme